MRYITEMLKKLGIILGWVGLGMVSGFIVVSIYFSISLLPGLITVYGAFPPQFVNAFLYGGGTGLLIGLGKAGVKVRLER